MKTWLLTIDPDWVTDYRPPDIMDICLVDIPTSGPRPRELDAVILLDSPRPRRVLAVGVVELTLDGTKRPGFRQSYIRLCSDLRKSTRMLPRSVRGVSALDMAARSPGWTAPLATLTATALHRRFRSTALKIVEALKSGALPYLPSSAADENAISVTEGRRRLATHYRRERSRTLINQKKREAKIFSGGALACEVCDLSSHALHPSSLVAERAFEVHHRLPLGATRSTRRTALTDLAIVCANCHRMLHATLQPRSL